MKVVAITFLLLALVACQNNKNTLILEIKSQGYYVNEEKKVNLNEYLGQVNNAESVNLVVLVDSTAKTHLLIDAINIAKSEKFKSISVSTVNAQ